MKSGIYKITNLTNGNFYIGSAKHLVDRRGKHFYQLKHNYHFNKHLQSAWNKYGSENFIFEILIKCPLEYLIKAEQWFLDNMKPHYNKAKIAGSPLGIKRSPETLALMSKIGKNRTDIAVTKFWTYRKVNGIKNSKVFVKYNNIITEYSTTKECSIALNIPETTIKKGITKRNIVYNKYAFSRTNFFNHVSKNKSTGQKTFPNKIKVNSSSPLFDT